MSNFEFKGKLFGANVEIAVFGRGEDEVQKICQKAYFEGVRLESIFNFFDKKSEISKLNEKRKMTVSPEFVEVLSKAVELCEKTEGRYDISLGADFKLRKEGHVISGVGGSYNDILISENVVELTNTDIVIDLGSIAKGYITDKIGEKLLELGIEDFLINSRGDILVKGNAEHEIKIQHPRMSNKTIATVNVKDGGLATSGDYKQFGKDYEESHILNSRSYASVSVFANNLMDADIYATVFSVISKEEIQEFLKEKNELKILGIEGNLKKDEYNGFDKLLVKYGEEDAEVEEDIQDYLSKEEDLIGLRSTGEVNREDDWIVDDEYSGGGAGSMIRPGKDHDPGHPDFVGGAS